MVFTSYSVAHGGYLILYTICIMSYIPDKQIFYINSNNRTSGSHSNFTYKLDIDVIKEYNRCVILSASIPKTFYLVTAANGFTLTEGVSSVSISITAGNYTRNSLSLALKAALNTHSPNGYTYNITYPNINNAVDNGLFTFTVTGNGGVQPRLNFNSYLAQIVGFDPNTNYDFSASSLSSVYVCNLIQESTLYLRSDMCQNKNDNVIQEIYTTGDPTFSYINFINVSPYEHSKLLVKSKSNVYNFYLTDENGNEINTNGININFTLMVFKVSDIFSLLTGYIKLKTLTMQ